MCHKKKSTSFPMNFIYRISSYRTLNDQITASNTRYFRHLTNKWIAINIYFRTMWYSGVSYSKRKGKKQKKCNKIYDLWPKIYFILLSDIVMCDTRVLATILLLYMRDVNMANYIIMHSHVLSHEKTGTIWYLATRKTRIEIELR